MTFFGLKEGQDLENWAAHLHQELLGAPPPPHPPLREAEVQWSPGISILQKKRKQGQKSNERKQREIGLCHEDTAVLGQLFTEVMA